MSLISHMSLSLLILVTLTIYHKVSCYTSRFSRRSVSLFTSSSKSEIDPTKINLFNSLTRTKDPFVPINNPKVSLYTCGPTVYDYAHIGNFRAFLTYDVLKRVLTYFGYDVDHICNLTDVDDKIIARCDREGVSLIDLTRKYERLFMEDLELLNIVRAREYPRATEHIDEMVEMICDLEKNGLAYKSEEGSWYFNVNEKEGYGEQLVNLDITGMKMGASEAGSQRGTDADEYDAEKVGVRDFALWKAYKPDFDRSDAVWETKIGKGRPGWHLECSAMAKKYLGETIDVHCGGIDLKFPHHENEIAQSEGASGAKFCNCWVHNGFVNIGDEKMSKSKGNFLTLRTACPKKIDIRAYRYLVVSSQYRNPLSFTEASIDAAKKALKRMDLARNKIAQHLETSYEKIDGSSGSSSGESQSSSIEVEVEKLVHNFELALADDLSMPRASASLFGLVKLAENEFKRVQKKDENKSELDLKGLRDIDDALTKMDKVFGIFYDVPTYEGVQDEAADDDDEEIIPEEVMTLVRKRTEAKSAKDWDMADSLRSRIMELGFTVKDVSGADPIVSRVG